MKSLELDRAELLAVLDHLGMKQVLAVEPGQLPPAEGTEGQEVLRRGKKKLVDRGLIDEQDGESRVSSELGRFFAPVSAPQAIVRTLKQVPGGKSWIWHFVTDEAIVAFSMPAAGQYRLDAVANLDQVAADLRDLLPLVPVPDIVQFQASVPQEDVDEIVSLLDSWAIVPAMTLLEADGMTPAEARDLIDDAADFEWSGRVDLMACEAGSVRMSRRVLVLQGQERAWLARQRKPGASTIHIETAQEGELEQFLGQYWAEIGA